MADVTYIQQLKQLERLMKAAERVAREIDIVSKAADIAHNVGSFRSQRLLAQARDELENALLKIREAQRVLPQQGDDEDEDHPGAIDSKGPKA